MAYAILLQGGIGFAGIGICAKIQYFLVPRYCHDELGVLSPKIATSCAAASEIIGIVPTGLAG
ncbi:hypothetical protein MJ904_25580 [Massilia sp. MB5]|uniref:hypothetical protein n=1 Tax=Massilia sp. MB5 TaxID=2919578 RepID=UPI001F0F2C13|nr:hypothetical protein [Massilia sp. MB5]UMR30316.1 hypothetical protein MJ904_25580 [Massilia sp. MB5]